MENDEANNINVNHSNDDNISAVNQLVLDYYKKFGRKRNIEQFFSLSTVQSDLNDTTSAFWNKMKEQNDSSDSGDKKSTELCRISIRCSMEEPTTSKEYRRNTDDNTESPPIISDEVIVRCENSDDGSINSDGDHSQKSIDMTLDTSNRPHSPTSSVTSQRKLEWDHLADVGYPDESDKKNSASSLSTLERLALHQQYSNNDSKQNSNIGAPTAHSTLLENNENKSKYKKGSSQKTTKFHNKDVDVMEVKLPNPSDNMPQPINVNLTKNISFNVEKDGNIRMDNITKNISTSPQEKVSVATEVTPHLHSDKEIQTSLTTNYSKEYSKQAYPVLINLNTLRRRNRKKKCTRKLSRQRKKIANKENRPKERSGNQVSEAESFEYMPGHMYNANKTENKNSILMNVPDNKSSLESSATHTTESIKLVKCSFSRDLEKSIDLLKLALQHRYEDENLKKRLIKEVIQRLIKTKYESTESSTDHLSGVSQNNQTTTSTSDSNNAKDVKPQNSILRVEKFNSRLITDTSQSVPNLPTVTNIEMPSEPVIRPLTSSTDSDVSAKTKCLSEAAIENLTSEQIYKKYLLDLQKGHSLKKPLTENEIILKSALKYSNILTKVYNDKPTRESLTHLMKDLARNNYDCGSGDASKLECTSSSNVNMEINSLKKFRSHSVFTLSSGASENQKKNKKLKNRLEDELNRSLERNASNKRSCCCSTKHEKVDVTDSFVQVNLNNPTPKPNSPSPQLITPRQISSKQSPSTSKTEHRKFAGDSDTENVEYVCLCSKDCGQVPENFLMYRCSKLNNKCVMISEGNAYKVPTNIQQVSSYKNMEPNLTSEKKLANRNNIENKCLILKDNLSTQPSQTDFNLDSLLDRNTCDKSVTSTSSSSSTLKSNSSKSNGATKTSQINRTNNVISESTRWVQTEISIDPRLSEPSMTDIRIIGDESCFGLIQEQKKSYSCLSSESDSCKTKAKEYQTQDKKPLLKAIDESAKHLRLGTNFTPNKPIRKLPSQSDKGTQSDLNDNDILSDVDPQKNFTIPIQGTNMTLKVSLGSTDKQSSKNIPSSNDRNLKKPVCTISKGVETVSGPIENFTRVQQECSKGVQSENMDILNEFNQNSHLENTNDDPSTAAKCCGDRKDNKKAVSESKAYGSLIPDKKYSTYPKESILKKPLLRSNTDTGKMQCNLNPVKFHDTNKKDADTQYDSDRGSENLKKKKDCSSCNTSDRSSCTSNAKKSDRSNMVKKDMTNLKQCSSRSDCSSKNTNNDPLLEIIQDITKRYSKNDFEKSKRKKCFKEIITVLNYLLDTGDAVDNEANEVLLNTSEDTDCKKVQCVNNKVFEDKGVQLMRKTPKLYKLCTESSDLPCSTDVPSTSTDSATYKVLHKIRHECEKYHKKRCKSHARKYEASSSTSMNCEECKHIHHCFCRGHKNHRSNVVERSGKKCVAYNLILQTSDSIASEEVNDQRCGRPLKNIIVKVPSKSRVKNMQFKEVVEKIEKSLPCSPERLKKPNICTRDYRSKSLPRDKETSSTDNIVKQSTACTVREYLEKNRPDFVEKCSKRQNCLKSISESRATERNAQRDLLSLHVDRGSAVDPPNGEELRRLAEEMGRELRNRRVAPKFISEKEMKKHSERIYKSLPEVRRKKEELKKERIKKTNLLMANMFKKNLQQKTLRGAVNLSNYSAIVKI